MIIRIGINGVGRIGRNLWRILHCTAPDIQIAAANDTASVANVAHLLRYDSIRGRLPATVEHTDDSITVDGHTVPVTRHPTPDRIDWGRHGVDVVIEATGQFTRGPAARGHLRGGAPRVVIPTATPDADVSLMMGINDHVFDPARHRVVSNSCCTTYCIATMLSPLHQAYGVDRVSATIAYSHGSRPGPLLDGAHRNPRMARANAVNIVPTQVPGVRYALDRVLPDLAGRVAALAMRIPVRAVSAATVVVRLRQPASATRVNATLATAASSTLKEYLEVSDDPLVSTDVLSSPASCVLDASLTHDLDDLVQLVGWHDNEWGYAHRLVDLIRHLAQPVR